MEYRLACHIGQIMRDAYTKKNGTYVPETCITDRGKPGKGPKILPDFKGEFHLRAYGYNYKKSEKERHEALKRTIKAVGDILEVERHLVLAMNKQADPEIREIMRSDVEYIKKLNKKGGINESYWTTSNPCLPGQIMRDVYTKKNGTYVDAVCIDDKGKPGKGPKTLPKFDDKFHLRAYGYSYKKSEKERHDALRRTVADVGSIREVEGRLVLAMNYQANPRIKEILREDVEFMKAWYKKSKQKN